jgi:hypothetical protein
VAVHITIHYESGAVALDVDALAGELCHVGFLAFTSGRLRQRAIAHAIHTKLESMPGLRFGEAGPPNFCMCMVDTERHDYQAIVDTVQRADEKSLDLL